MARLIITAVILEGRSQAEVARSYGISKGWVSKLITRYRDEGDAAFEPRSRAPHTSPNATSPTVLEHRSPGFAKSPSQPGSITVPTPSAGTCSKPASASPRQRSPDT